MKEIIMGILCGLASFLAAWFYGYANNPFMGAWLMFFSLASGVGGIVSFVIGSSK